MKTRIALFAGIAVLILVAFSACGTKEEPVLHPRLFMPALKYAILMDDSLTISWEASKNAVGYRIDLSDNSQFDPIMATTTVDPTTVTSLMYVFRDLPVSTLYYYRLIALATDEQYNSKPVTGSKP